MHPAPQPFSVLSSYVRHDHVRAALIQRGGGMVRPSPIGTTAIVCLKLDFPVAVSRSGEVMHPRAWQQRCPPGRVAAIGRRSRCAAPAPAICTRTAGSRGFRRA